MTNIQYLVITLGLALFPGLPCFCLHSVYNTWKQKSGEKWGRPGSIHHINYVKWLWGGSRERVAQSKKSTLDHLFKCSTTILDSRHLQSWNCFPTHFQAWCVHIWILAPPHYVHLASTQVMIAPWPSRFLATLLFPCINVRTIKWKIKWRRPGLACKKSPAKKEVSSCISMVCSLECWAHKETAVFTLGQSYICPWC